MKTSTQERTPDTSRAREPWGPILDMMSIVQGKWETEGGDSVKAIARQVAREWDASLRAEGWSEGDFVETCKLLMGKFQHEVAAICAERGWRVPHYA